jgi:hypothetical protein
MPQSSSLDSGKNETPSSDDNVRVLPALTPSLNRVETSLTFPSPLAKGEATVPLAGEAAALQHVMAFWLRRRNIVAARPAVAPYQEDFLSS